MGTFTWDIVNTKTNKYFQLHISDSLKEMQEHSKELGDIFNIPGDPYEHEAQFIPFGDDTFVKNDEYFEYKDCYGYMLLAKDHLSLGILYHELFHVSKYYDGYINKSNMNYSDIVDEERLAYLLGDNVSSVTQILIDCKYLKKIKQLQDLDIKYLKE